MSSGAPTGMWDTIPPHLKDDAGDVDLRAMKPRLVVRRPGVPEVTIPIERRELTIGRDANEVDLVLDDDRVSRKHAKLSIDGKGYVKVEDLGSANGMRFAGRPVRRLNLHDGDVFTIGKTELEFHAELRRLAVPSREPAPRDDSVAEIPEPRGASDLEPPE